MHFQDRTARKHDGVFYTPVDMARTIVEQSVGAWLRERRRELRLSVGELPSDINPPITSLKAYREQLLAIRVLDPACGSGVLLNEAASFLENEGRMLDKILQRVCTDRMPPFDWAGHILENVLFGVDIHKNSVELAKATLWLNAAAIKHTTSHLRVGNALISDASIAGCLAFDWHAAFPAVMASGGFDAIVGNPPYVDSETMRTAHPVERKYLARTYRYTRGNWDLYIAFFERGCELLAPSGYLTFITPDKWLSKNFGAAIRTRLLPNIRSILPVGRQVFADARIDSVVTTISGSPVAALSILSLHEQSIVTTAEIDKANVEPARGFDRLFSRHRALLQAIEAQTDQTLGDIAAVENACATSDAYTLAQLLKDLRSPDEYVTATHYRVANTGTLDRYGFHWGVRPMRYLNKRYLHPVMARAEFIAHFGPTYRRRTASPKIIIKGLTLLDAALDLDGSIIPGKSTLVVCSDNLDTLKFLAGLMNSALASFYIKQTYSSSSYNGGVVFTPAMLNALPIPRNIDKTAIIAAVNRILGVRAKISTSAADLQEVRAAEAEIDDLVCTAFQLTQLP